MESARFVPFRRGLNFTADACSIAYSYGRGPMCSGRKQTSAFVLLTLAVVVSLNQGIGLTGCQHGALSRPPTT